MPTDTGHWEIYVFAAGEGRGSTIDEDAGLDLNYGPIAGIQLTATLPTSFSHAPEEGWRSGSGDVELGVKYRFYHDEENGVSAAIFPRVILPTASHSPNEKARFLVPLWVGKDFAGGTSLFGGGGFTSNPGTGNRDFWQAGLAATQDLTRKLSIGAEITRQGAEVRGATSQTRVGVGSILQLSKHANLLFSGGPTWADHEVSYRFYAALGLNF
ncbi:transporter [Sphingomonas flavescens]|uniref:transporter n=1 Tax=Sphingomonas flavescens TaxID=3132797 RepID=UPI002804BC6E|nr:transporter [Sphingomonas limnosediminicola]